MKKKIKLLVLPAVAFVAALAMLLATPAQVVKAYAANGGAGEWTAPKFVVLGDSIAEEYGSRGNGYASNTARAQGYELFMLAKDGWTTHQVLNQVTNDEAAREIIASADIIQLVIGGNDLRAGKSGPAIDAVDRDGDYTLWEEHCQEVFERYTVILDTIRELNPDAAFFVFNQYTPNVKSPLGLFAGFVFGATRLILGSRLWTYAHNGHNGHMGAIPYWNTLLDKYLDENPDAFVLVDADKAFRDAGNASSLYTIDMIHPSTSGHVVLQNVFTAAINEYNEENMVAIPSAVVTQLKGNKNILTVTVTEHRPLVAPVIFVEDFTIDNNAIGEYEVGEYTVYVNTKGNDQIRACYLVA